MKKERMTTFIQSIQNTGLVLKEPDQYKPHNPFQVGAYHQKALQGKGPPVKPWSIVEEWYNVNWFGLFQACDNILNKTQRSCIVWIRCLVDQFIDFTRID